MDDMKKVVTSDKITGKMVNGSLEIGLSQGVADIELNSPDFEVQSPTSTETMVSSTDMVSAVTDNELSKDGSLVTDELKIVLKQQLEEIFSQENFSKDKFLISQLDSDQYISLDIVMHLKQIECLTCDSGLILELLKELPNLQIDLVNRKVRLASPRSTIILREVPQSTPKKEIERLFDSPDCPHCVKCEFAGNENWYVTFLTEDDAHKAYNHLRENVQNFLDKPIKARIKTSNTFIPTSSKPAPGLGSKFCQSPQSLDGLDVANQQQQQQQHHAFPAQAPASFLPNYIVPQTLHFYHDLIPAPLWTQKFMEPYNICPDYVYTQPIYGYPAQDNGANFEGNPRQHKSTNSVHFRSGNHYPRSHGEYGGGGGGGYSRYSSHGDSRPPPRFLRQQLAASMASVSSEGSGTENHLVIGLSRDDDSPSEKNSIDSKPAQSVASVRHVLSGNERHIPNGFVKGVASSSKSSPDDGYSARGRRLPERSRGYRGSRRVRNSDDGDKNIKARHQDGSLRSPKSPAFQLEPSSFPPLSSISNISSAPPPAPPASCGTSYVQAVANSSSSANSYQSSQQKLPQASPGRNSPSTTPYFTASEPLIQQHATTNINNNDDLNGASDNSSKMPLMKLSYAQIAQGSKQAPLRSQECDECNEPLPGHADFQCPKTERNSEKNPPLSQQQQSWNKKKHQGMQSRKNGENFKSHQRNCHEEEGGKHFKPARRGDLENERQFSDKMEKVSKPHLQHNSIDGIGRCAGVDGKLVAGDDGGGGVGGMMMTM